jgi:hypothetical protein
MILEKLKFDRLFQKLTLYIFKKHNGLNCEDFKEYSRQNVWYL